MENSLKKYIDKKVVSRLTLLEQEIFEMKTFVMQQKLTSDQLKSIITFNQFKEKHNYNFALSTLHEFFNFNNDIKLNKNNVKSDLVKKYIYITYKNK